MEVVLLGQDRLRYTLSVATLVAAYYGAAHVGYVLNLAGPVAALIWLPAGVGIAGLYLGGPGLWPAVLIGDLLVNDYSAVPLGSALGQTCGNVLEALVAALLIRRLVRVGRPLSSVANLSGTVVALAAGTAASATIGVLSLWLGQVITSDSVVDVWRTWWLGDTCGALVIVPLAIDWYPLTKPRLDRRRVVEATLLVAALAGLSMLALDMRQLTYLVFPGLIWAAVRFNERGATVAVAIVVAFTMWTIAHYIGPFGSAPLASNVLRVQLFIAVTALSTLYLAAVVSEREAQKEQLGTSRARLIKVAATERRRLERNLHDGAQQRLTALAVRLGILSGVVREDPDRAAATLDQAEAELSIAIQELRELAHGVHPTVLTRLGLGGAIKSIAESSGLRIELVELPANGIDRVAEATAYYVMAEAITNVQKHAHASSLRVRAGVRRGFLEIEIADDGVGGAVESGGFGLEGLRDRIEVLGGRFEVDSVRGRGTRISAAIPTTTGPGGT